MHQWIRMLPTNRLSSNSHMLRRLRHMQILNNLSRLTCRISQTFISNSRLRQLPSTNLPHLKLTINRHQCNRTQLHKLPTINLPPPKPIISPRPYNSSTSRSSRQRSNFSSPSSLHLSPTHNWLLNNSLPRLTLLNSRNTNPLPLIRPSTITHRHNILWPRHMSQ